MDKIYNELFGSSLSDMDESPKKKNDKSQKGTSKKEAILQHDNEEPKKKYSKTSSKDKASEVDKKSIKKRKYEDDTEKKSSKKSKADVESSSCINLKKPELLISDKIPIPNSKSIKKPEIIEQNIPKIESANKKAARSKDVNESKAQLNIMVKLMNEMNKPAKSEMPIKEENVISTDVNNNFQIKENVKVLFAEPKRIELKVFQPAVQKPLFSLPQRTTNVEDKELDERLSRLMGEYREPIINVPHKEEKKVDETMQKPFQKVMKIEHQVEQTKLPKRKHEDVPQIPKKDVQYSITKPASYKFNRQNPKAFKASQANIDHLKEVFKAPAKQQPPLNAFQRRMNNMNSIKSSIKKCNQVKMPSPSEQAAKRMKMNQIQEFVNNKTPELVMPIAEVSEKAFSEIGKFFSYKMPEIVQPIENMTETRLSDIENAKLMMKMEDFFRRMPDVVQPIEDLPKYMYKKARKN